MFDSARCPTGTVLVVRGLIQRVSWALVDVGDDRVGEIGPGLCVLVGVTHSDTPTEAQKLANKVANLRIFDDHDGVMNRSLIDVAGEALVISQFTLYGDTRKGRRPSWTAAAPADVAEPLVSAVVAGLTDLGVKVATGQFQADMAVSLCNDGPVTVTVEV